MNKIFRIKLGQRTLCLIDEPDGIELDRLDALDMATANVDCICLSTHGGLQYGHHDSCPWSKRDQWKAVSQ